MAQLAEHPQRFPKRPVRLSVFAGVQIDAGKVRQHARDAPAIVDLTQPGEAVVVVSARGAGIVL